MKLFLACILLTLVACSSKTYWVVRHAEKAPVAAGADRMMASDPPLSEAGEARAEALKERLKREHITAIFSTNFKRTRSTAEPLSRAIGIAASIYSPSPDSLEAFITRMKSSRGSIVIIGHSNTIDDIANKLVGKKVVPGDLPETEYDNLYIIKQKGKKFLFRNAYYGAPTR